MSRGIEEYYVSEILILGGDFLCHVKLGRWYTGHHENCLSAHQSPPWGHLMFEFTLLCFFTMT